MPVRRPPEDDRLRCPVCGSRLRLDDDGHLQADGHSESGGDE